MNKKSDPPTGDVRNDQNQAILSLHLPSNGKRRCCTVSSDMCVVQYFPPAGGKV